jgi:hypothetical protein
MVISVSGTWGFLISFTKIKGHNNRTEKVFKTLPEVYFMVLGFVHEFHMDSYNFNTGRHTPYVPKHLR